MDRSQTAHAMERPVRRASSTDLHSMATPWTEGAEPHLVVSRTTSGAESEGEIRERARRILNVAIAVVSLVVALPLMLVIAAAVKLTSSGPVLFTQKRVGMDRRAGRDDGALAERRRQDRGGRLFTMYKFRTMYQENGGEEGQTWARPDDPRVTPVGKVLRKTRLDELPQLFNVLRGDMNIVGPRPEQPDIFLRLRDEIDHYHHRQSVLPGITGWAQVNHSYDQCLDDVKRKVELDLEYIERRSAAEDLKILARTVPVMLGQRGAL